MKNKMKKKKKILVIEDERSLLEAIKIILDKNGFDVIAARSVEQAFNENAKVAKNGFGVITIKSIEKALDYLESLGQVDAIWLDHELLGKEDGLDFVTKFKANGGRWNKIPIFVVSNMTNPSKVQSYVKLGVTKYYVKVDHRLEEIVKDIKTFLN